MSRAKTTLHQKLQIQLLIVPPELLHAVLFGGYIEVVQLQKFGSPEPAILLGTDALSEIMANLIMQTQWLNKDCHHQLLHHPTARG